jgi:hypothetical protein
MTNSSDVLCESVDLSLYDFDYNLCLEIATQSDKIDFGTLKNNQLHRVLCKRNDQTDELLERLRSALIPCKYNYWLWRRGIKNDDKSFCSIDYDKLSQQDMLDLFLYPMDHIITKHGMINLEGPAFCDYRNQRLVGIGVRNISMDLEWVSDAKFTFSNFGLFLFGYDYYNSDDLVYVVEGVFDVIKMRQSGYNAVALGSAFPTAFQLSCLLYKFKNLAMCLDNDFHGWCGSLVASEVLGLPIYTTVLKDAGSYEYGNIELRQIDKTELRQMVKDGAVKYNENFSRGSLYRDLPYNK